MQADAPSIGEFTQVRVNLAALFILLVIVVLGFYAYHSHRSAYKPTPPSYSGDVGGLADTDIAGSLEQPIDATHTVIWSAALSNAWLVAKTDLFKGPIQLEGDPPLARQLNEMKRRDDAVALARAGWVRDGIVDDISQSLSKLGRRPPDFGSLRSNDMVAYALVLADVKFTTPYPPIDSPIVFTDARGVKTPVNAWGLQPGPRDKMVRAIPSPNVLLYQDESTFAVDPDPGSTPYQLVLATLPPQRSLAEALDSSEHRIRGYHRPDGEHVEVLLVPTQCWDVSASFRDLERPLSNRGFEGQSIRSVSETVSFRLDRSGAQLASDSSVNIGTALEMEDTARRLIFDRPFLVALKPRNGGRCFFAMWVANASLLQHR